MSSEHSFRLWLRLESLQGLYLLYEGRRFSVLRAAKDQAITGASSVSFRKPANGPSQCIISRRHLGI